MNKIPLALLNGDSVGGEPLPGAVFFPEETPEHTLMRTTLGISEDNPYQLFAICAAVMAYPDLYAVAGEKGHTWDVRMVGRRLWGLSDGMKLVPGADGRLGVRREAQEWPTLTEIHAEVLSGSLKLQLGREKWYASATPHPTLPDTLQVEWPEELRIRGFLQGPATTFSIHHNPVRIAWSEGAARLRDRASGISRILTRQNMLRAFELAEDDMRTVAVAAAALVMDSRIVVEGL